MSIGLTGLTGPVGSTGSAGSIGSIRPDGGKGHCRRPRAAPFGKSVRRASFALICLSIIFFISCAKLPVRQYYVLTYVPQPMVERTMSNPYACVIRLKDFSIEEAYNRSQIVYRSSPYQLRYYNYRSWAVRPARMITDLVFRHLNAVNLVSSVVRRFDEGRRPDYELSGTIEALEEYDSDDIVFAHVAIRFNLTRLSDGQNLYSRLFDVRKRVYRKEADFVVREMSLIMEYIITQAIADIDARLATEFGINAESDAPMFAPVEEPSFISVTPDGDMAPVNFEDISDHEGPVGEAGGGGE